VTLVTAALMHRTAKYLITFTPKFFALAVAAVSAKSNTAKQNPQNFTISALFS